MSPLIGQLDWPETDGAKLQVKVAEAHRDNRATKRRATRNDAGDLSITKQETPDISNRTMRPTGAA